MQQTKSTKGSPDTSALPLYRQQPLPELPVPGEAHAVALRVRMQQLEVFVPGASFAQGHG
ncbi:MAG: hypothetical protein COZ06_20805 [Armatimonadetes bacterium CG_4_10_14_3_um_filter_66_18]|nr:MAG: hypothetical protein COS65_14385 [Armatimonadetes bacterium CG06_land_8_20_14_3_00_66_21]PIX44992.1 MAG: hypothetical protein COZ57_16570 [Armatimonadetes bacterium CG_4_8_14_3_um_filter_66_20]PIY44361.1 MAG: hypothetical protein COZ06_20805 [Armatimonadetes bacterium CG_4_10_14_3_um_filter_66_18]PJB62001.1 MAG: hypothetical protein CO096_26770 [Armatimonadetes bacterium CG_4_9_14_3_um_filter_66_14]